ASPNATTTVSRQSPKPAATITGVEMGRRRVRQRPGRRSRSASTLPQAAAWARRAPDALCSAPRRKRATLWESHRSNPGVGGVDGGRGAGGSSPAAAAWTSGSASSFASTVRPSNLTRVGTPANEGNGRSGPGGAGTVSPPESAMGAALGGGAAALGGGGADLGGGAALGGGGAD